MNAGYSKTKANKFFKNFVRFSQFAIQREMILENLNSKSICLNIQVFVRTFWSQTQWGKIPVILIKFAYLYVLTRSHKGNPYNANVKVLIIAEHHIQ